MPEFAKGGIVSGHSPKEDRIPAVLNQGSRIFSREALREADRQFLKFLNQIDLNYLWEQRD